jgi:hypothetical protein
MLVTKSNQHKPRRRSTAVAAAKRGRRALPASIAIEEISRTAPTDAVKSQKWVAHLSKSLAQASDCFIA